MAKYSFVGKKVILRRKIENAKEGVNYDFTIETSVNSAPMKFSWTKKNNYQCEVPTKVEYIDEAKKRVEAHVNYAQFVINAYKDVFEVVGEVEEKTIVQPTVVLSEADVLKKKLAEIEKENKELAEKLHSTVPVVSETPVVEQLQQEPAPVHRKIGRPKKQEGQVT